MARNWVMFGTPSASGRPVTSYLSVSIHGGPPTTWRVCTS